MSANLKKGLPVCFLLLTAGVCRLARGGAASEADLTVEELIHRYRKAVTCWDTAVAMRIEVAYSWTQKRPDRMDIRHWEYDMQHRRDGDRCEWFGRYRFDGELDGEKYTHAEQFRQVVGDDFFLYYGKQDSREEAQALMGSDVQERRSSLQAEASYGGFLEGRMGGMGSAETIAELMSACGDLRLIGQETLSGTSCYIVEAKTRYGTFTVWIAPDKGYNALKYTVRKNTGDILYDNVRVEDRGITECVGVVDAIEVGQIDGVFVPISGCQTGRSKAGDEWELDDHVVVKRSEIALHPDFVALDAFKIDFPEGTEVTHKDIPELTFRWTGGRFVPEMDDYLVKRLTGKSLPSLEGLIGGFDSKSVAGKPILVCFWDMQQRSSRHGIVTLRDNARRLADQDLVIVAIQASKVDRTELDDWIRDNRIPFPMGMIRTNEEKTRNHWGVKSLPWLILTDAEHRVVGEGLGLEDLDKELEKVGAKK